MSESVSRAERRALRRVAGAEVTAVVEDTAEAIRVLTEANNAQAETIEELRRSVLSLEGHRKQQAGQIVALQQALLPLARTFAGRVRWMVTGR